MDLALRSWETSASFNLDGPAVTVPRGVAWLDENRPGWVNEIDLARLDMKLSTDCILGQLYGRFWNAPSVNVFDALPGVEWATERGFWCNVTDDSGQLGVAESYEILNREWINTILDRRLAAAEVTS